MVTPSVGSVVLVRFPFSDLSATKLRPAVVLAGVDRDDWILSQVTSKLFSANSSIMVRVAGVLKQQKLTSIIDSVIDVLRPTT